MSQFTKKAIVETFLELLKEHSLDKITVKDIVEKCGINRNTFYYYYQDIYDLIDDVFDIETKKVLEDEKQYESWYEELLRVALFVVENRPAILHIYDSKSRDVLEKYLFAICDKLIRNFEKMPKNQAECEQCTNLRHCSFFDRFFCRIM